MRNNGGNRIPCFRSLLTIMAGVCAVILSTTGTCDNNDAVGEEELDEVCAREAEWANHVAWDCAQLREYQQKENEKSYYLGEMDRPEKEIRKIRRHALLFKAKRIEVEYDSKSLFGEKTEIVYTKLYNQGFSRITIIPLYDIGKNSRAKPGTISKIEIGTKYKFSAGTRFAYDIPVKIYSHEKKEILLEYPAKFFIGGNYKEVYEYFQELGFSNIKLKPMRHVIPRIGKSNGAVELLSINGDTGFGKGSRYEFDVEVIIKYRSFLLED